MIPSNTLALTAIPNAKAMRKKCSSVNKQKLQEISLYIQTTLAALGPLGESRYFQKSLTHQCSPFHIARDGRVYIHLKEPLKKISEGDFKSITHSICYQTAEVVVKATSKFHNPVYQRIAEIEKDILVILQGGHRGIVRLYDFVYHESQKHLSNSSSKLTLIFQNYNEGDLRNFLKRKRVKQKHLLRICTDFTAGLSHLHSLGIAHQDFKPANILIEKIGKWKKKRYQAVVTDFGLSCSIPQVGKPRGTPTYWPPEYFANKGYHSITSKADLWALGCIFYRICYNFDFDEADDAVLDCLLKDSKFFNEPANRNSLAHLSWQLLSHQPNRRPEAAHVMLRLQSIDQIC